MDLEWKYKHAGDVDPLSPVFFETREREGVESIGGSNL